MEKVITVNGASTPTPDISTVMNGVKTEEASVVRPISVVQPRNTRLSFLNKRKISDPHRESTLANGDAESPASSHGRSVSKDNQRRGSFFRVQSSDLNRTGTGDQSNFSDDRRPSQASGQDDQSSDGTSGLTKRSSVRKRLSMLKLGKKSSKTGVMGSLDEE